MKKQIVTKKLLTTYKCIKNANGWVSVQEISDESSLPKGTVNRHFRYLVKCEILEVLKTMNFYFYRMMESEKPSEVKEELENLLAISR